MKQLKYKTMNSPVGVLTLVANDTHLLAILWDKERPNRVKLDKMVEDKNDPLLLSTEKELNEYFSQNRTHFTIPMKTNGTSFQNAVWQLLLEIPYGETWSYKEMAEKLGRPKAVRAVGAAIGRNPLSIIIPCHRFIATSGSLTGFAGGLGRKKLLLDKELLK